MFILTIATLIAGYFFLLWALRKIGTKWYTYQVEKQQDFILEGRKLNWADWEDSDAVIDLIHLEQKLKEYKSLRPFSLRAAKKVNSRK